MMTQNVLASIGLAVMVVGVLAAFRVQASPQPNSAHLLVPHPVTVSYEIGR